MTRLMTSARSGTRTSLLLAIAASFLAVPAMAYAAGDDVVPQATLHAAGTDFTSSQSVTSLKRKLRQTAYHICSPNWDGKTILSGDERKCYDTALHNGMAQIDSKQMEARRQTTTDMASAQPQEHPTH